MRAGETPGLFNLLLLMAGENEGARRQLRSAAVEPPPELVEQARLGFHRAFPQQSAKRVFTWLQIFLLLAALAALVWAVRRDAALVWAVAHALAFILFAAAIIWRLFAAASLTPLLSRLAEPQGAWPIYTLLCPLYREADVVFDLVAALERIDYPGLMHQRAKARCAGPLQIGAYYVRDYRSSVCALTLAAASR